MASVTPTLVQEIDQKSNIKYGSSEKRLTKIYLEVTSTADSNTLDLVTYVPNLQGIIGVEANSLDGADASNDTNLNTWSSTTLTMAGHAGSGVWKITLIAHY